RGGPCGRPALVVVNRTLARAGASPAPTNESHAREPTVPTRGYTDAVIDKDILAPTGTAERELLDEIDLARLPRHIAIIMDGNGRWAKQRGSPRVEGHRAGIASVREAAETSSCRGMTFNIALNYGGRTEIVDACRSLAGDVASGRLTPEQIDEETLGSRLGTAGLPDPDLLIRTSGEMRVSNFLLWQIAYSEIWVTPTLWPDFRKRHLFEAILE